MSRERKPRRITWTDEAGRAYAGPRSRRPSPLGAISRRKRLVDVLDVDEHHLASLVRNGAAPPLLHTLGPHGPVPTYALTDHGLVLAVTMLDDDRQVHVGALGEPSDQVEVTCRDCRRRFALEVAIVRDAVPTRPTGRTPVVRVGP